MILSPKAQKAVVGPCDATCKWLSAALAALGVAAIANLDAEDNAAIGDITRFLPPAAGLAMTVGAGDWQGSRQWLLAGGSSLAATWGLKHISDKERPNAHNYRSFPSGHATSGFFGAGFIYRRYGPKWGVPAWVVAAYTGASRVNDERHYVDDVLSSLSLGLMSNWLFTTPISERVAINPMLANTGLGISVSIATSTVLRETGAAEKPLRRPRFRYSWEFGPSQVTENVVATDGDPVDFRFEGLNDPAYSASFTFAWAPANPRHEFELGFTPFERRDFGSFDEDSDFGGVTWPRGDDMRSRHIAYDLTARYRYRLVPEGRADLRVGAGVAVFYTLAGLAPTPRRQSVGHLEFIEVKDIALLPIVHLRVGVELGRNDRWLLFAEADGMDLGGSRYLDASAQLRFQVSPRWDVGLGYRRLERRIDRDAILNETRRDQSVATIGYRF